MEGVPALLCLKCQHYPATPLGAPGACCVAKFSACEHPAQPLKRICWDALYQAASSLQNQRHDEDDLDGVDRLRHGIWIGHPFDIVRLEE